MGILRLLPLALLLLLPAGLREYLSPAIDRVPGEGGGGGAAAPGGVVLHPIVLVPGVSCSELEVRLTDAYRPSLPRCGAMKGKGWFGLWANCSDLPAHHLPPVPVGEDVVAAYVSTFQEPLPDKAVKALRSATKLDCKPIAAALKAVAAGGGASAGEA
ncbi:hypothetical protein C2845_PM08G05480 [Panicum miliaceum]|uniref:Uncharacterized protein n=1 Tax=Panicum miliaceum TaxID=4540 RepID=A0A3L6QY13_PANMI|nr:hypothetical protein C2845_PM08G05480 [Panicum miliaceum]